MRKHIYEQAMHAENAEDMKDDSGAQDEGDGSHMNDLFFSGHLRTRVGEEIVDQSIS